MRLQDIEPQQISSVVQRNRRGTLIGWTVGLLIVVLTAVFAWPYPVVWILLGGTLAVCIEAGIHRWQDRARLMEAIDGPREFPSPPEPTELASHMKLWPTLLDGTEHDGWVLFAYGTCVVVVDAGENLVDHAKRMLREFGPACPGTHSGDMLVYPLPDGSGWVIGGHCPNIFNVILAERGSDLNDFKQQTMAGHAGRRLRVLDAFSLNAAHSRHNAPGHQSR